MFFRVQVIEIGDNFLSFDAKNSTGELYQVFDRIIRENYSDFCGGIRNDGISNILIENANEVEPWRDASNAAWVSEKYSITLPLSEKTDKEILVAVLSELLSNTESGYRLGCVNNHCYKFRRPDGSEYVGIFRRNSADKPLIENPTKTHQIEADQFIDSILKVVDCDDRFSMHIAAHLCNASIDAERDEFFGVVSPKHKCIIMIGLFYNRFYY